MYLDEIRNLTTGSRELRTPMTSSPSNQIRTSFPPRARLLQLLGDELIGTPRLAVFELAKNAYDADATHVIVRMDLAREAGPRITVTDDGKGTALDVPRSVWLVPSPDPGPGTGTGPGPHPGADLGPAGPPEPETDPAPHLNRFHVGVEIDLMTAGKDASEILEEVVSHPGVLPGASVTLTLKIDVEMPEEANEDPVPVPTENATTLGFASHGFEEEGRNGRRE